MSNVEPTGGITSLEAARQLGVSRRTLTRWITAGRVKAYGIAGHKRRYVDMDELRRLRELKPIESPKREGGEA
jgi:excisionase family DNA binding protein